MNIISFSGSETSGSIGVRNNTIHNTSVICGPSSCNQVNFKGKDEGRSSTGMTLVSGLISIALVIGGLGFIHKKNLAGKLKNNNLKNFLNRVTEPCYNICHKIKHSLVSAYKNIKDKFSK